MAWLLVSGTWRPKPTANWPANNDDVLHEIKILKTSIWQEIHNMTDNNISCIIIQTITYLSAKPKITQTLECQHSSVGNSSTCTVSAIWSWQSKTDAATKLLCCSRTANDHEKQNSGTMKLVKVLELNFSSPCVPCTPMPESILFFLFSCLPSHGAVMALVLARCGIHMFQGCAHRACWLLSSSSLPPKDMKPYHAAPHYRKCVNIYIYIVVVSLRELLFNLLSSICHHQIPSVKLTMCVVTWSYHVITHPLAVPQCIYQIY